MILTVIEHAPSCPLDRFESWLTEHPARPELQWLRPWDGDVVGGLDAVGDGLVVLGGHADAYDDAGSPWLPATRALLADAVDARRPTLGICLGAQLLAVATGGQVQVAAPPGREAGVIALRPRPEAADDPLLGGLEDLVMPSMHADAVVSLPRGAVWLASSRLYPYQAFRVGRAWGLQFHPEVAEPAFARWAASHDDVDTDAVVAQLRAHQTRVADGGRALAHRFVDVVAGARTASAAGEPAGLR